MGESLRSEGNGELNFNLITSIISLSYRYYPSTSKCDHRNQSSRASPEKIQIEERHFDRIQVAVAKTAPASVEEDAACRQVWYWRKKQQQHYLQPRIQKIHTTY